MKHKLLLLTFVGYSMNAMQPPPVAHEGPPPEPVAEEEMRGHRPGQVDIGAAIVVRIERLDGLEENLDRRHADEPTYTRRQRCAQRACFPLLWCIATGESLWTSLGNRSCCDERYE